MAIFTPKPTPYIYKNPNNNPYVPAGQVGLPVSKNALPVPQTPSTGGTNWVNNTYGFTNTGNYSLSPSAVQSSFVPFPKPVPTPPQQDTSSQQQGDIPGTNLFVGDIRGNMRWTGAGWEPAYGGYNSHEEQQKAIDEQINASYKPAYENLNTIEAQYKDEYPTSQAFIEQSYADVLPQLQSEQNTKLSGLKAKRTEAQGEEKNQIASARRRFNELRQSGLTRFGGASSTGEAYGELLGRTTAEQMGATEKQFGDLYGQITSEETNVNNFYAEKKTNLEKEKQLKLQELKNSFDAEIRKINTQRTALDSEKAARRLAALQEYAAQARQMAYDQQVFQQKLDAWKAAKDEAITLAKQFQAKSFTIPSMPEIMGGFSVTGTNLSPSRSNYISGQGSYSNKDLKNTGLTPTGYNRKTGAFTYGVNEDEEDDYGIF